MTQVAATFLAAVIAAVAAIVGAWTSLRTADRARRGTYDHAVVEKRLEEYGRLVAATSPFAIHFPPQQVDVEQCRKVGRQLRKTYYSGTGIIFSKASRDMYMTLVHAVSKAAAADSLNTPDVSSYADRITVEVLAECRRCLGLTDREHAALRATIDDWEFGLTQPDDLTDRGQDEPDGSTARCTVTQRFVDSIRDYVLLQHLASLLRTELADDIVSRRRPE